MQNRLDIIFNNIPDAMLICDADGIILETNKSCEKIFKYTSAEMIGRHAGIFSARPYDNSSLQQEILQTQINIPLDREWAVRKKSGREIPVQVRIQRVQFGEQTRFLVVVTDLTKRLEDRKTIENYRKSLQVVFDSIPSALIAVDQTCAITHWNLQAEKLLNVAWDKAVTQPLHDILPLLQKHEDLIQDCIVTGISKRLEKIQDDYHETRRYYDVSIAPLLSKEMTGALIRIDDITQRVRLEEMVAQTEKMISMGGMAAGIAHEINNPLASVIMGTQVLEQRLVEDSPANARAARLCGFNLDQLHSYLESRKITPRITDIRNSAEKMAVIISNMLEFQEEHSDDFELCSLNDLVRSTIEKIRGEKIFKLPLSSDSIQIMTELKDSLPLVECIPSQIELVLTNLLRNAAQAIGSVPYAECSPRIRVRSKQPNAGSVVLEVEDNGPGINEATRKRIFEPFFSTNLPGTGTGLGLSISFFVIVRSHHGRLGVYPAPAGGALFKIQLPISQQMVGTGKT
jgi:PAS domain S-box-containing protein